jgi:hypothetical protein
VAHLQAIDCKPEEVAGYFRLRRQTLASLYILVSKLNPSPSEMKKMALRFALDARMPIEGDIDRFTWRREPGRWEVVQYPSVAHRLMQLTLPPRLVDDAFAVAVLDCVFRNPPPIHGLMELIESIFNGPSQAGDTLEGAGQPCLTYAVAEDQRHVRLWVGDREVQLVGWRDVHQLLRELCTKPDTPLKGREAGRRLGINNASQAASEIRKALEATLHGAREWLLTNPIRWATGHVPQHR